MHAHTKVLAWVNDIRAARSIGEPLSALPKGTPQSHCSCPIARALGRASVTKENVQFGLGRSAEIVVLPEPAKQFVVAFDDGHFPELRA